MGCVVPKSNVPPFERRAHVAYGGQIPRVRLINRRMHERIPLSEPIIIRTSYAEMTGRLLNLSNCGAAIDIRNGLLPGLGEDLAVTLRDNKHLWGRTCRVDGGVVAIQFSSMDDQFDELCWIEQRGWNVYANR